MKRISVIALIAVLATSCAQTFDLNLSKESFDGKEIKFSAFEHLITKSSTIQKEAMKDYFIVNGYKFEDITEIYEEDPFLYRDIVYKMGNKWQLITASGFPLTEYWDYNYKYLFYGMAAQNDFDYYMSTVEDFLVQMNNNAEWLTENDIWEHLGVYASTAMPILASSDFAGFTSPCDYLLMSDLDYEDPSGEETSFNGTVNLGFRHSCSKVWLDVEWDQELGNATVEGKLLSVNRVGWPIATYDILSFSTPKPFTAWLCPGDNVNFALAYYLFSGGGDIEDFYQHTFVQPIMHCDKADLGHSLQYCIVPPQKLLYDEELFGLPKLYVKFTPVDGNGEVREQIFDIRGQVTENGYLFEKGKEYHYHITVSADGTKASGGNGLKCELAGCDVKDWQ